MNELTIQAWALLFRIAKAFFLAAITYYSLRTMNFSPTASISFALVPATLGSLNIITGFIYRLTAIIFVIASGLSVANESNLKFDPKEFTELTRLFSNSNHDNLNQKKITFEKTEQTMTPSTKLQSSETEVLK